MAYCWLCRNVDSELGAPITNFVNDNAQSITLDAMCAMVSESILCRQADARGASPADVKEHLNAHTLAPGYCVPRILRQLLDLGDKLHAVSVVEGEDGVTIENRSVQNYLEVVSKVMTIYKSGDPSKLAFGSRPSAGPT
jgi:hypothetical protein